MIFLGTKFYQLCVKYIFVFIGVVVFSLNIEYGCILFKYLM